MDKLFYYQTIAADCTYFARNRTMNHKTRFGC